ncbi:MAG: hypothetical protein KatS3mg027_0650 [Bacteroidia bacterium]|nr:MAG: hypothetical protein KatS3mg027_0650 [Bacteroidia bacterium]
MFNIEPFSQWRNQYKAEYDVRSPFYGREYDLYSNENQIYNFIIHPYWDFIGSETLYIKILFADYERKFAIMELIGEWNDAINNDIMHLKRNVIDEMLYQGIRHFILIGENVLNFHSSDDCYYEEWWEDIEGEGWIVLLNFRDFVLEEMRQARLGNYLIWSEILSNVNWRKSSPVLLFEVIQKYLKDNKWLG